MCVSALTAGLEESLGSSAKTTLQAIGAQEAALTAIARHTNKLKEAMDSEVNTHTHNHLNPHSAAEVNQVY